MPPLTLVQIRTKTADLHIHTSDIVKTLADLWKVDFVRRQIIEGLCGWIGWMLD